MTNQTGSNNRIHAIWAGFGLQFGAEFGIINYDANHSETDFLPVLRQFDKITFDPRTGES